MEINETLTQDLRREFKIVVGAADLDSKLTGKVVEMQPRIHLKGFRPGKAPLSYLKKTYRKSLMGEIVNSVVKESSEQALKDRSLKPATAPRVDFVTELEAVVDGKADLEFTVCVDLMPEFELGNLSVLKIERLVAEVSESDIDDALTRLAESQKVYNDKGEGALAENADSVTIDFEGKIDGKTFDGGKGEDFELTLGSASFIPGFEEQLLGAKAGEQRTVKVTFPENYGSADLAGKAAAFDVRVKAVKAAGSVEIDDKLAAAVGVETLSALRDMSRDQLKNEFARASRGHLKRRVLDALDGEYDFSLPSGMVETEFDAIWRQVQSEIERDGKTPEEEGQTEEELRTEYHAIAERRVRLGLVLAKIGEQNGLQVSQDELNRAVAARARQYPGQEQQIYQFIAKNPQALAEIRVPLFEDKVVDFIAELVEVKNVTVDRETLFLDPDAAAEKLAAKDGKTGNDKSGDGKAKPKSKAKSPDKTGDKTGDKAKPKSKTKKKAVD